MADVTVSNGAEVAPNEPKAATDAADHSIVVEASSSESATLADVSATKPTKTKTRAPALFVNHGGGPMPLLGEKNHGPVISFLTGTVRDLIADAKPRAIIVVSAHWEVAGAVHISSAQRPEMIFDYYGFPSETYKYHYDAPGGSAELVEAVRKRIEAAKLSVPVKTEKRGFDHGVFVPLMLARPEADIPIVTVSLEASLDPSTHLAIGRALAPLRDEGIAILGSGQTFHNMGSFRGSNSSSAAASKKFNDFLIEVCTTADAETRNERLQDWETGPEARFCHPREEHLIPLMVVAGSSTGPAKAFPQQMLAKHCASFVFA